MTVSNMAQLQQALLSKVTQALSVANQKSLNIMKEEVAGFYNGGTPVKYKRTGQLKGTPTTTGVVTNGNSVSFEAKLDSSGGYSSGRKPSMMQVLRLTNYGDTGGILRPAVGSPGYWEKAEVRIEQALNDALGKYFD